MKRTFLLLLFALIFPCLLFGQSKKRLFLPAPGPPTKKQEVLAEKHNQCLHQNKFSAAKRRAFFPFRNAYTIKLISFEAEVAPNQPIYNDSGNNMEDDTTKRDTIPVFTAITKDNFSLNFKKVKEIKTITIGAINSLTDILYNIGFTPVKNLTFETFDLGAKCYEPRNAVLFIDKKGNISQYLEICFGCQHHFWSSSKVEDVEYCDNKYELLRKYFLAQGIKYGTDPKTIE
jgi:hypothetical protein